MLGAEVAGFGGMVGPRGAMVAVPMQPTRPPRSPNPKTKRRHPDLGDPFCMSDVTAEAEEYERGVDTELDKQMEALHGSLPDVSVGPHCHEPLQG